MIDIRLALRYFVLNYPHKNELSKTRMTKMVYLADWLSSQKYRTQLTKIKWHFDHYGPYVSDVFEAALKDNKLIIQDDYSAYGSPKQIIALRDPDDVDLKLESLSNRERGILNEVILKTQYLNWTEFIEWVYSTYPITTQKRYSALDLVELAEEEGKMLLS